MLDTERIVGFQWDAGNRGKNQKHGVTDAEAEQLFFQPGLLVATDTGHSAMEPRCHALGITLSGRQLHVTFTLREQGSLIRVISARDMHRKERMVYEAHLKTHS